LSIAIAYESGLRAFEGEPSLARFLVTPLDLRLLIEPVLHEALKSFSDEAVFGSTEIAFPKILYSLDELIFEPEQF